MRLLFFIAIMGVCSIANAFEGIVIHHTASDSMTLDQCNEWHNANGWNGCGYNFIISREGEIVKARPLDRLGAHARGRNDYIGIALVGHEEFTIQQIDSLRKLANSFSLPIEPHHEQCPTKNWPKLYRQITIDA